MLVEMSVKGLMVDPVTNMPIVILRDAENQRVLPIWVGPVEAIIADLRENTFYAYLELHRGGDVQFLDARPSDALALAIRSKAPVFVDTKVLEQAKSIDAPTDPADQERLTRWLESLDPDDLGYKM